MMASLSYISTEETTNASRACRLFLGPCTDELRDILRHHVPPTTFPQVINSCICNLPTLTKPERELILPKHGSYTGNYNDMDVSLLYKLLRNICNIPPHNKGWGHQPDSNDSSLSANIETIRLARNRCIHSSIHSLSNADFTSIWSTVRSAIVDMDTFLKNGNKYEKEVDFLRYETMDPQRDEYYQNELRTQIEEDQKTREIVEEMREKLESLQDGMKKLTSIPQKVEDDVKKLTSIPQKVEADQDRKPSEAELMKVSRHIGPSIQLLGTSLGFDNIRVQQIIMSHHIYDVQTQIFQILVSWKRKEGQQASVRRLLDAIREIKDSVNFEEIENIFNT